MKIPNNTDEIIRAFEIEISNLKSNIEQIKKEIKEKQDFVKELRKRHDVKLSELYLALENDYDTFWKINEVLLDGRKNSFYEIKVNKKYFFPLNQVEIIQKHFMLKFTRTFHEIRIFQFY